MAFAEGAQAGYAAGLRDALEVARDLYGPWRFDAGEVWRGLERAAARAQERLERQARG